MIVAEILRQADRAARAGKIEDTERLSREALRLAPHECRALSYLGWAQQTRGAYREAADTFHALTQAEPRNALHWANLGTALRSAGEFDRAMKAYQEVLELDFVSVDFLLNLGLLHLDRYEYGRARAVLKSAAELAPDNVEIRFFHAASCYGDADNQEAEAALRDWRQFRSVGTDMLLRVASLLTQLGVTEGADHLLQEALRREPRHALASIRLAELRERTNRTGEARQLLQAIPAEKMFVPELREDLLSLESRLAERSNDWATAKTKYQQLLQLTPWSHQRYHVLFPLARVHDELGECEEAMRALREAHESQFEFLQRAAPRFTHPGRCTLNIVNYSCVADDIARWHEAEPPAERSPIFIVGFPRSGTTLLEQALDAHPLLRSMDEQPFLQKAIDEMGRLGVAYPEKLADLDIARCEATRARYWTLAQTKVALEPGQRLVDKNPLNLLRLPAIRRLFPRAKIILAIRHPCDVLLSNYMQHYRAPEVAIMSRTLESLADGYRRAFDFWYAQQALLDADVLELRYEDLVRDFERHVRGIAEFLCIPWDDSVLEPAEHARRRGYISTPSYCQVVQPVNEKAVARWHKYEAYMRPVIPALSPFMNRWRYLERN